MMSMANAYGKCRDRIDRNKTYGYDPRLQRARSRGNVKAIALDIGVSNIAYMRFAPDKSSDASLLFTGTVTYSFQWQTRYFLQAIRLN